MGCISTALLGSVGIMVGWGAAAAAEFRMDDKLPNTAVAWLRFQRIEARFFEQGCTDTSHGWPPTGGPVGGHFFRILSNPQILREGCPFMWNSCPCMHNSARCPAMVGLAGVRWLRLAASEQPCAVKRGGDTHQLFSHLVGELETTISKQVHRKDQTSI